MKNLSVNQQQRFRIVEKDGRNYILVMSGGVFEHEIIIMLKEEEVAPLLADEAKQIRIAGLIRNNPDAFAIRKVDPSTF